MGRPDLTETRRAEILDAFEKCVARHGLTGSSLERVAEEAGMRRSILRHYIGNRDALVRALAERVVGKYKAELDVAFAAISTNSTNHLIDFFFPSQPASSTESVLVIEALIAESDSSPEIAAIMREYVDALVSHTTRYLEATFPNATKQRCTKSFSRRTIEVGRRIEESYFTQAICFYH